MPVEPSPSDYGGTVKYRYRPGNNTIFTKYGRPSYYLRSRASTPGHSLPASPAASRPVSRVPSLESMNDAFYSLPTTPRQSFSRPPSNHRLPSWLDMTMARRASTSSAPHSAVGSPLSMSNNAELRRIGSSHDFKQSLKVSSMHEQPFDSLFPIQTEQGPAFEDTPTGSYQTGSSETTTQPSASTDDLQKLPSNALQLSDDAESRDSLERLRAQLASHTSQPSYRRTGKSSGSIVCIVVLPYRRRD